ncbi:MAG: HAD family phosphatase [Muribaculaceae bacterium]|nr:HAD family phosphatase [Muribaculaceae bacterium]
MTLQQTIAQYLAYTGHKGFDIQAALIDCDGVLYDSMKYHTQAWVKLMKKNGIKCTRDEFYEMEGMTGSEIIKMKFKQGVGKNITDDEALALYGVKTRYFRELGEAPVMPGAVRVLETLKEAGVESVLVTGSQQTILIDRIENDFPGLFGDVKVTGHDVRKGKPNPEPYLKAMAKAGKKSNQCIVIENAPLGVQAGHAAGCFTIGVTTGPIPEKDFYKAGADLVYKNMDELAAALPSLLVALTLIKA